MFKTKPFMKGRSPTRDTASGSMFAWGGGGLYQDPPCTLNWGYMVPNGRYLGPNRG